MKHIANILTNKNFPKEPFYNIVSDKKDLIDGIPTLVVGWDFTKENFPQADIVNSKIEDGIFWTFGNRERRSAYEVRTTEFRRIALEKLINDIEYKPVSVINGRNLAEFNNAMTNIILGGGKIYINGGMLYAYYRHENVVYGVSMRDIDYIGKSSKDFLSIIYQGNKDYIIGKCDELTPDVKYALRNCNYVIPYLLS